MTLSPPANPLLMNLATLLILAAPLALAMTGVLGGGAPGLSQATTAAAELRITAPRHIRSGMIGEIRIRLSPMRAAAEPAIIIPDDWLQGVTINHISPQPSAERAVSGGRRLEFPPLAAGSALDLSLAFQVNPDRHGRGGGTVRAVDGETPLASLPVRMTVLP